MGGGGQVVGGLPVEGGGQPLFGCHRFHGQNVRRFRGNAGLILAREQRITLS
jgi:hypothetical protein